VSYATIAQVRDVLARDLTHPAATAASLPDAQIQECADDASTQIDSALGYVYPTPFAAPYPRLVVTIARDIGAYLADLVYRGTLDYGGSSTSPMLLRYQRALQQLKDLQSGDAKLTDWPPPGDVIDQSPSDSGTILPGLQATAHSLTRSLNTHGPDRLRSGGDVGAWGRWW
jgi:phage gp36-like protein